MTNPTPKLIYDDETILPDDYSIYADYVYLADGVPIKSNYHGITAWEFKKREKIIELRRCNFKRFSRR